MKVTSLTRRNMRINNALFLLLLLTVMVLLAWLSTRYDYQADWTASGRNTLSAASIDLLEKMPEPIHITSYAREVDMLRRHINDIVSRYQRYKDDIDMEFINPDLEPQKIRDLNITVDGEMVIEYQGRVEQLREFSERGLTNALQRVLRSGKRRLVFVQGHGEREPRSEASFDLLYWVKHMEQKGIEVTSVNLASDGAVSFRPGTVLVVTSPRSDYLPGEVTMIQDYITSGGSLLWLADPGSLHGLQPLAEQLGLEFHAGLIMDPNISQVGMMLFGTDDPRITLVASYPRHPLVDGFSLNTLFPMSQMVGFENHDEWQGDGFLYSLTNTWQETGEQSGQITFDGDDIEGPLQLGVSLTRNVDVPEGIAIDDSSAELESNEEDNIIKQRIVIVGDGDFLSNAFLGMGGNLQLAMNIINWLGNDDQLVAVPVKTANDLSLQLSNTAVLFIGVGFLLLLPALLLACGFVIWWRRRKN